MIVNKASTVTKSPVESAIFEVQQEKNIISVYTSTKNIHSQKILISPKKGLFHAISIGKYNFQSSMFGSPAVIFPTWHGKNSCQPPAFLQASKPASARRSSNGRLYHKLRYSCYMWSDLPLLTWNSGSILWKTNKSWHFPDDPYVVYLPTFGIHIISTKCRQLYHTWMIWVC